MRKLALTISPPVRTKCSFANPDKMVYDDDLLQIRSIIKYNKFTSYIIYPEFDDRGRLHYHGKFNLDPNQYIRFYKHAIHKFRNLGFCDIKLIRSHLDSIKWLIYISKNWSYTKEILDIDNPIYPISSNMVKKRQLVAATPSKITIIDYIDTLLLKKNNISPNEADCDKEGDKKINKF